MHKILNKLAKGVTNWPQKILESEVRLFASFAHKDFAYQQANETGQLTTRLLRHLLVEKTAERPVIARGVKFSELFPVHREQEFLKKINSLSTDQLARSIVYASIYKNGCLPAELAFVVNNLDNLCTSRLDEMDLPAVLQILNAFMYLIPHKLVKLDFYRRAMPRIADMLAANANVEDFLKACFFLGCWKKDKLGSELMDKFLRQHLQPYLDDGTLTTTDFAVICHAAFKTSVKMTDNAAFRRRLESEIVSMAEVDDALIITFIKSARLVRLSSAKVTDKLRSLVLGGTEFHFAGYVHILTYFADNLISDAEVVPLLIGKCMETIFSGSKPWRGDLGAGQNILDTVRGKDLANFLWACAHLNLAVLTEEQLKEISKIVEYKIENQEYDYRHNELTDTILSLWMLNHRCQDLVVSMLTSRMLNRPANVEKFKLETRKHLLINAVDIEAPEILRHCNIKRTQTLQEDAAAPDYLVKNRPGLQNVHQVLLAGQDELSIKSMSYVAQIRHLNIAGLLVETVDNRKIHVEVLEDGLVLSDQVTPMGIFALKSRLLKASGCQTITVNPKQHATDEELLKHIQDQIIQIEQKPSEKSDRKVRKFQ